MTCISCSNEVSEEYARCAACKQAHKELADRLDARPKPEKKPKERLIAIVTQKKVSYPDGMKIIPFTDYYTEEQCRLLGIKIPDDNNQG